MYTQYGEHGMDGWDYSRALQVLGDCYLADYINLEECLDLSLPIAKKLQSAFTSWEELADSYIYGYAFWQNETADDVETKFRIQAYAELVEMENSHIRLRMIPIGEYWKMGRNGRRTQSV